jgi:NADPH:quinone reductase-like Zn-dependent oxidoreductase
VKIAWRERWGGPEVVAIRDVPTPEPTGNQVRVKVHASSVNRADLDWLLPKGGWLFRLFLGLRRPRLHTLGIDVAGTVEAAGPDVTRFKPGDRVYGDLIMGGGQAAFAEQTLAPERRLQLVPEQLSFEEAATLPHSAALAVMSLKPYWGQTLQPGQRVMIVGASGNVGPFAVQIAKARGLHVTGVCRTSKLEFVRALGADDVVDYTTTDYTTVGRFDRIIDVDAHRSIFGYRKALHPGGVYLAMGGNARWIASFFLAAITFSLSRGGVRLGLMPGWRPFHADEATAIRELVESGALKAPIDRTYPLADVRQALADVHEGRNKGKIVVTMGDR